MATDVTCLTFSLLLKDLIQNKVNISLPLNVYFSLSNHFVGTVYTPWHKIEAEDESITVWAEEAKVRARVCACVRACACACACACAYRRLCSFLYASSCVVAIARLCADKFYYHFGFSLH